MARCPSFISPELIGVMADSHGQADRLAAAIRRLTETGCRRLIHLGDITDTNRPETVAACIHRLVTAGVCALRGNNDHALAMLAQERTDGWLAPEVRDFLDGLPFVRQEGRVWFAHSLPFVEELGPACLVRPWDAAGLVRFNRMAPAGVLFCGHRHQPEMLELAAGRLRRRRIAAGEHLDLRAPGPRVIACGAITEGWSMIYAPEAHRAVCLRG